VSERRRFLLFSSVTQIYAY